MWQNSLVRQPNKTDEDIGIQFENEIVRLFRTKVRRDLTNHNAYKRLMEKHLHGMSVFFDGDSFTYPLNKTNQDSERHFEIKNGLDLVNHTVHKQVTEKNLHGKSVLTIENVSTRLLNKTNQNVERLFETQAGQNLTDHISHNNSVVQKHLHEKSGLLIGDASTRPTSKKNQNFGRHSPVEFGRQFGIEVGPDLAKQTTYDRVIEKHLYGKSILFIGDSLTRYQYLNLVYFLATGEWSSPFPHNENEKEFASWNQFYATTTQRNKYEICDCYRGDSMQSIVENRYFSIHNINISYIQYFLPSNGIKFHEQQYLNVDCLQRNTGQTCQQGCLPGACTQETGPFISSRALTATGVIRSIVSRLHLTDIITNVGIWGGGIDNSTMAEEIGRVFRNELKDGFDNISLHWKMTTHVQGFSLSPNRYNAEKVGADILKNKYGWNVYDTWMLTHGLEKHPLAYWDVMHFVPFVYQYLNRYLILHLGHQ